MPRKGGAVPSTVIDSEDDILDDSDEDMFADPSADADDDADPKPTSPSLNSADQGFEKDNETTPARVASISSAARTPPSLKVCFVILNTSLPVLPPK